MRSHIVSSEIPLKEGETHKAICGAEVEKCIFESGDVDLRFHEVRTLVSCKKCAEAEQPRTGFFYAVIGRKK